MNGSCARGRCATTTATFVMPYSHPQPIDRQNALRQIPHLVPGAMAFAGMAGYINSVTLGFFRTPVSHMTGAVSYLGVDLAEGKIADATASLAIIVGFLLGGVVAGTLVGARKLLPGRRYGAALIGEAALLTAAVWLITHDHLLGLPLVAMACGLQNAMTSSYCGLMIRSTHVTGVVTDIGVMLGHWVRHRRAEKWKLWFLCAVFAAFGAGGWLGAWVDLQLGPESLAIPAAGCAIAGGVVWILAARGWLKVTDTRPEELPRTASFPHA
jgi:uncharacterized membrane protein YoaK (UPF0700 family)